MTRGPVVVDASALAEFLLWTPRGQRVADVLAEHGEVHAPHLLITETLSVLRGWVLGHKIEQQRAGTAGADLAQFPVHLWDARPLTQRVWARRDNLSAYDATYVALAEAMGCALVTGDVRMARAVGAELAVRVVP
jgi:predicted nucleic acid-binding protein